MPSRRTIRKPTVWTPEEWRHIEEAAAACGVRPLRYVRQASLAAELPPCTRRRGARALLDLLAAVLDTLHHLLHLAQAAGAPSITAAIESTIRITSEAAEAAAARRGSAEPLIIAVREAGRVLDGLTDQTRAAEALPANEELGAALVAIQIAALGAARVTLGRIGTAVRSISTPSRRTIRKTTVWTPDEWRHIEEEARTRGVPPMRHVREVALAAELPPHTRRRRVHALVREFKWVLNNLHQLLHLAEDDGAPGFASGRYFFHPVGNDKPLHSTTILLWTKKAFKAAGIRYGQKQDALTFHNLRHTFASWLVQGVKVQGSDGKPLVLAVDVLRVAKLLGDSVDQVIETYGHLMPENLADAVAMIDRKIGRDEVAAAPADKVAVMRAEIARLREESEAVRADFG